MARKPPTAATLERLRAMRQKYRLGEYSGKSRRRKKAKASGRRVYKMPKTPKRRKTSRAIGIGFGLGL